MQLIILANIFDDIIKQVENSLESLTNLPILIYQLLATLILILVIKFFFWEKITKFLDDQRRDEINKKSNINRLNKEANLKMDKVNRQYDEIKSETQKLRQQLIEEATLAKEKIIDEAKQDAKQKLLNLKMQLQQEVNESQEKIKIAIKEIAYDAAEKILKRELRSKEYDKLIDDITQEIEIQL